MTPCERFGHVWQCLTTDMATGIVREWCARCRCWFVRYDPMAWTEEPLPWTPEDDG